MSELQEQMVGGTGIDDDAEPVNRARASRCCLHGLGRVRIPILLLCRILYYNGQGFENVSDRPLLFYEDRDIFFNSKLQNYTCHFIVYGQYKKKNQ